MADEPNEQTQIDVPAGILRKAVLVAGAGDPPGSPLKRIEAGTNAADIPASELAQLCQEHFLWPD